MQPNPNAAGDCVRTVGDLARNARTSTLDGQVRNLDHNLRSLTRELGCSDLGCSDTLQLLSRDAIDDAGTPPPALLEERHCCPSEALAQSLRPG